MKKTSRGKMYLYLVSNTWKKVHMNTLLYSAPAHCLLPPPKGLKFFATTCCSRSCNFHQTWSTTLVRRHNYRKIEPLKSIDLKKNLPTPWIELGRILEVVGIQLKGGVGNHNSPTCWNCKSCKPNTPKITLY